MKNFFINKFEYNYHSNKKIIELIEGKPKAYTDRSKTLIGHTFNAHNIWNNRIIGRSPTLGVWDVFELSDLHKLNSENLERSFEIIEEFDLKLVVNYKNSSGVEFTNRIDDILFHIINHSTYHRGQLMTDLKLNEVEPISTDFIFYAR